MAKPKLALIPSTQGTKLYSVLPANGVGDFAFTRGSSATRINSQGLIETVASGVSRLNYPLIDGVVNGCPSHLLEPSKQNVLQRSEEFDNAYWVNNGASVNPNQTISPSGQLNADLLTGVSGGFGVIKFSTWNATNKVASFFAKKGSSNLFKIANASLSYIGVTFDLENGTVTNEDSGFEGEIENYGNGWFRCTAIDRSARSGTFSLGVTAASESVYIWGAQLESDYKTSYIPTTTSAATRSAETANGAGDASTFNDSEGVLFAEISALANDSTFRFISLSDGTSSNRVSLFFSTSNTLNASVNGISSIGGFVGIQNNNKVAFKYKSGDYALWVNGIEVATSTATTGNHSNLDRLNFDFGQGSDDFYGNVKQIQYFDSALTDAELISLTTI